MTLSDSLRQAAQTEPGDLDLDAVHAAAGDRRRRRTRRRVAGSAVAAVALVAGLAVAVGAEGEPGTDVRAEAPADPSDPGGEGTTPVTEPPASTESTTTSTTPPESTTTSTEPTTTTSTEPEPTTTSTEPAPTTAPPSTTAPPPPAAPTTWTYDGLEQYRLNQPQCPDITHWMDADAIASDGSAWTLREDYCGGHSGGQWSGTGTFTLAGPGGETLTGRTESTAPVGTTGVPYTFFVEGGTGRYAGAGGECTVTTTMSDQRFGSQRHEGTITCDLLLGEQANATSGSVPESA